MQQGQTYILIARFPNPNYGVKMVTFIINSHHLSWAPRRFLFASLRGLSFVHACRSNASLYYAKTKEITMDFRNKVNNNILSQILMSLHEKAKGVSDSTKGTSFWNSDHTNVIGVQWRSSK